MRRLGTVGALALASLIWGAWQAEAGRWGKEYVPNVPVVTQDGKTLKFYDDLIKDKIVVLSFIYTSCKDICPLATARLGEARDKLGERVGRDIFFYSISIDPEHDTPQRLKQYADAFQAGPGWLFLTGLPEDIQLIRYKFGDRRPDLGDHRNDVVLGNGLTGEWQRENALGDIEHFVRAIEDMESDRRGKVSAIDAAAHAAPQAQGVGYDRGHVMEGRLAGSAMFVKLCAGCHTIGRGDRVGPDLDGLTLRRSRLWISEFLADPIKMRARQDPIALALAAKFPGVRMPYLKIHASDAADLISYIDAKSKQPQPTIALETLYAMTTQDGGHLTPADLKGQPFAVVFGYTHCPDVCPTTLLEWSNLIKATGNGAFKLLFVSVDQERDTPSALKALLASFDPHITALTGSATEIAAVAREFGAFYQTTKGADGELSIDHTVKSYLVDQEAHVAGSIDPQTPEPDQQRALAQLLVR
ncbi:MAG TPA: SCO family protein [Hyphomicrobiaceae bacterium]|jgi:protein SCO1/2|nr:SCO family protein [Hyphomicrobiaceae bacterium]